MWTDTALEFASSAGIIVIIAAALQTAAYLFSSQITLRFFLLLGTAFYLLYYFVAADDPLWPAIFGTGCIATTSIYGLVRTIADRSRFTISKAHLPVFKHIGEIEPGAFRKLMKHGQFKTFTQDIPMTKTGIIPDNVYFTLSGDVDVVKKDHKFAVGPHNFIGEISIMGGFAATADVYGRAGTTVVVWNRSALMRQMEKDERFRVAVEAVFARDMAVKLSQAVQIG
ncbi:MAG: hypothetical protein WBG95_15415 [Sulfitobacter sp.]